MQWVGRDGYKCAVIINIVLERCGSQRIRLFYRLGSVLYNIVCSSILYLYLVRLYCRKRYQAKLKIY